MNNFEFFCFDCSLPRFRQRLSFIYPNIDNLHEVLDAAKAADVILLLLPADGAVSPIKELYLSTLLSHGLPSVLLSIVVNKSYFLIAFCHKFS